MKNTMFKRTLAGIAAVFTLGFAAFTSYGSIQYGLTACAEENSESDDYIQKYKGKLNKAVDDIISSHEAKIDNLVNQKIDALNEAGASEIDDEEIRNSISGTIADSILKTFEEYIRQSVKAEEEPLTDENIDTIIANMLADEGLMNEIENLFQNADVENSETSMICSFIELNGETLTITGYCEINDMSLLQGKQIKNLIIGSYTTIRSGAFSDFSSIESVKIADNCTIENSAFKGCNNIKSVVFEGTDIGTVSVGIEGNPDVLLNVFSNNTASVFSDGSVLTVVIGGTFIILFGLAAVLIVNKRKYSDNSVLTN